MIYTFKELNEIITLKYINEDVVFLENSKWAAWHIKSKSKYIIHRKLSEITLDAINNLWVQNGKNL